MLFRSWCDDAEEWLKARGYRYETLNVNRDPAARAEMIALTEQTYAPVIEVDGEVLADFDTGQLEAFWRMHQFERPL